MSTSTSDNDRSGAARRGGGGTEVQQQRAFEFQVANRLKYQYYDQCHLQSKFLDSYPVDGLIELRFKGELTIRVERQNDMNEGLLIWDNNCWTRGYKLL